MQTEVAEVFEPAGAGRGGSSTLPHKRNPVGSVVAQAAALRVPGLVSVMLSAMVQEHERAAGGWHAEWETLPEIFRLAAGALAHVREIVAGLEVDAARMRKNLDATAGLILAEAVTMALAKKVGRDGAHKTIEQACRRAVEEKRHLREILLTDAGVTPHLTAADLDRLFDPANYLGSAVQLVEQLLAQRKKSR
jgi:3-carboxy-cis,cis-muconate cycloisomerase